LTDRYDVLVARPYIDSHGEEKTSFARIGVAWPMKERDGFSITLEALPLPSLKDGKLETRILMMPPKPREEGQQQPQQSSSGGYNRDKGARRIPQQAPAFDSDDDIPGF
jgi:hypothetical protein